MSQLLTAYLADVEEGLRGLPRRRRKELLRELEASLLDEAESAGLASEEAMASLLAEKEPPRELAETLARTEDEGFSHRRGTKLLAGGFLALATGGYLFFLHRPMAMVMGVSACVGLAIGVGVFWGRRRWQRLHPAFRVLSAMLLGTVLALPLAFAVEGGSFESARLLYGAFVGYLAERLSGRSRSPLGWALDNVVFTALLFYVYVGLMKQQDGLGWMLVLRVMRFNFVLQFGVWAALRLQHLLDGRWVLSPNRV